MKGYFFFLFFSCQIVFAQEQEEFFIDYEKDKKWIDKVEHFNMGTVEKIKNEKNEKKDFFYHINNKSEIRIGYNSIIETHINRYLSYKWLPKIYGLLSFYEPLFEMKLREYGLPTDLKYLAIVESNLNPQAGSWAGASGLWQFMPLTGERFGLAKNKYINLFYDPYLSTDAACKYLSYLYKIFKDWNLVLSAYNSGEGRVLGAIKKAGTKDYWEIRKYLPKETKAYAPSFHAVRYVGENYALYYKIKPQLKYSFSDIKELNVKKTITFKELAKVIGMDVETLYFLNPHIVTEKIPVNTFVYYIKK